MKAEVLRADRERTIALVFGTGEEPMEGLLAFARREGLASGHFTAIGAFEEATLGYFDWSRKDDLRIPSREQVEVLSLVGDVARVRPPLEVVLVQPPGHLRRRFDATSRLALIEIEEVRDAAM